MTRPLIAHIVFRFDYGGLENGVVNVVNGLTGGEFRHVVIALTEATSLRDRLPIDVAVHALGKRPGKDLRAYWRLFRTLRALEPAVVHTRNVGTIDCLLIALLAGVPLRIHGEHGWDAFDPDGKKLKYRLIRRLFHRFAHTLVTVSEELQHWLVRKVGLPAEKVQRIRNGVDTVKFRPRRHGDSGPAQIEALGPDSIVVGSVTRFSAIKDPMNLIEAFLAARSVADIGKRLRLVMIGDGELRSAALSRLERAGADGAAWLPGSRDNVAELLRAMDVFVLGSAREGISNTVLEAMASGLPVIATATGGNLELVQPGRTGELVPPGDHRALAAAIERYARSAELRANHGQAARERAVAEFSIGGMIENYRRLYAEALRLAASARVAVRG